jgi:hypothetical protein
MRDKPQPRYSIGQLVRIVLNERNRTPHTGSIRQVIWHHKDGRYNYYIEENGKKIAKRYFEEDLQPIA